MCGIVGIIGPPVDDSLLSRMRDSLSHRGPDDSASWISPDLRVGLAHRRLSILDLSPAARQPFWTDDQSLGIVFNGEIYNFEELRKELVAVGARFRSRSDTEVLLSAYREWGEACFNRLNGMFALAILDKRNDSLTLARDRMGKKPLYFFPGPSAFVFASELRALQRHPQVPSELDLGALNHYLARGYVPRERSILRDVRKLLPGHYLKLDLNTRGYVERPYWTLPPQESTGMSGEDLLELLGKYLVDAVQKRLVADVPVGVLLSGGFDSSLIVAAASRAGVRDLHTFTITNPGEGNFDEAARARVIAQAFGTRHTELSAADATLQLEDALPLADEPMADSSFIPCVMVSRLARRHVTVALAGDGGDELFAGYNHYRTSLRLAATWGHAPGICRRLSRELSRALPIGTKGRSTLDGLGRYDGIQYIHRPQFFDAAARRQILRDDVLASISPEIDAPEHDALWAQLSAHSPISRYTRFDIQTYLSEDILVKVDRASMSASLEVRAPWLDHRIVDLALRLTPDRLKTNFFKNRILQRSLARRWLPASVDMRLKQGFSIPLDQWLRGRWRSHLESPFDSLRPYIKEGVLDLLRTGLLRGRANGQRWYALKLLDNWIASSRLTPL